jgi:DNA-binding LacI/PurR family transcriptional regulator
LELAKAIHYADKLELRLGKDIGILAQNDSCLKDILAGGITVLSNQPDQMGTIAAQMILDHDKTNKEIELKLILRKSL